MNKKLDLLCRLHCIPNPEGKIPESALGIAQLIFRDNKGSVLRVEATDLNRGGRAVIQVAATHQDQDFRYVAWATDIYYGDGLRKFVAGIFPEAYEKANSTQSTLLFGIKKYHKLEIIWKSDFFK